MQMKYNSYVSKTANLHCCKSSRDQKLYSGNRSCMWHKGEYRTMKKTNYPRIQRSKRLMHWFHFKSVCDILHVRIVKTFLLHSAADFLGERKVSIFSSFHFFRQCRILHRQNWTWNPDRAGSLSYWSRFWNAEGLSQQQTKNSATPPP